MNKNRGIIIALVILIAAAIGAAFFVLNRPAKNETTTSKPAESITVETWDEPESTTAQSTTAESTTAESATVEATVSAEDYEAVKTGVWYLFDDDARTAYAFEFTGKDRVEIAYFDSNNADGLDAKYFTTSEDYEIKSLEGETVIELADPINESEEFMFTVQKGKVCFGKEKLRNEKEVSLDIVFNHFN
ncbi:MAG: hypothetical protein II744_08325 [Eubacterium sp.]|nr:hypothetical protein [Eubacterium sp.]